MANVEDLPLKFPDPIRQMAFEETFTLVDLTLDKQGIASIEGVERLYDQPGRLRERYELDNDTARKIFRLAYRDVYNRRQDGMGL